MNKKSAQKIALLGMATYVGIILLPVIGAIIQDKDAYGLGISIRQLALLGNSLLLGLLVTLADLVLGFFCALFLRSTRVLKGALRYYFVLLLPIPFYIYALSWMYLIKLLSVIWPSLMRYSISGLGACAFAEILAFFPIALLLILVGIESINADELRMALVYSGSNGVIYKVVLKELTPYFTAASGLILTLSLTDFSVPSMFQFRTYALDVFSVYSRTGSALTAYLQCIPLLAVLLVPVSWLIRCVKIMGVKNSCKDNFFPKLSGITYVLALISFVISILQLIVPVITFIFSCRSASNLIFSFSMITSELEVSFFTSLFAAIFCLLIGLLPAAFVRNNIDRQAGLIAATMAIPGAIQAMGLLKIVNLFGFLSFERSFLMTSLGCAIKVAPYMVLWLCISRMRADEKAIEMASVFAKSKRDYLRLKYRILAPGLLSGFAMAFFMAFAEESIALILMAPGKETVTVKIYNYLHYGASEYVSGFSIAVMLFIFAIEFILVMTIKALRGIKNR